MSTKHLCRKGVNTEWGGEIFTWVKSNENVKHCDYVFQSPAILHVVKYVKMQEAQLFMGVILDN